MARFLTLAFAATLAAAPAFAGDDKTALRNGPTWTDLQTMVVGDAELLDGEALLNFDAPYRAHDAAVVPIRITQRPDADQRIVRLTLVIDENPAPIAAEIEFGALMGPIDFETRVRVDQYSNIRAIAETEDGKLWMVGNYVKASGGCSAPAMKDMEAALANAGVTKAKFFDADTAKPHSGARREAQVMVRHPNYSGMQRNQVTQLFIPAFYVDEMEVFLGDDMLFSVESGISISENPTFRFTFTDNGAAELRIKAGDTDGNAVDQTFSARLES